MFAILPSEERWTPWTARPFKWRGDPDRESTLRSDHITITLPDGTLVWRGWFRDRYAAVEFWRLLDEGGRIPAEYWSSPHPIWMPGLEQVPGLIYEFLTQVQLISSSTNPWTIPALITSVLGAMIGTG